MSTEDIIKELERNKTAIFCILKERINFVNKYFFIKNTFENGKIKDNDYLQNEYKYFYGMNRAFLGEKFFKKYFGLLEERKVDLKEILNETYKCKNLNGQNKLQFAFATKLLHTINNDKPIYDKHIGEIFGNFGIQLNGFGLKLSERIKNRSNYYQKLENEFEKLLDNETVKELIKDCRKEFKCEKYDWSDKSISDLKVLDFMLWAHNQIK